jgi:hypothetical protein
LKAYFPTQFATLRESLHKRKTEFDKALKEFERRAKKKAKNGAASNGGTSSTDEDEDGDSVPYARRIVDRAIEEGMTLYKTANRDSIAAIESIEYGTHYYDVGESNFSRWVDGLCLEMRSLAPKRDDKKQAIDTIHAMAQKDGDLVETFVRVATHKGKHYIDMCNDDGEVIVFDEYGINIITEPPVIFMRYERMLPLPRPKLPTNDAEAFKQIRKLKELLNVDEKGFMLATSFLLAAMRMMGGYPILNIYGPANSAKTWASHITGSIIDPYASLPGGEPRDERTYFISGYRRHVLVGDNLSTVRKDRSDHWWQL